MSRLPSIDFSNRTSEAYPPLLPQILHLFELLVCIHARSSLICLASMSNYQEYIPNFFPRLRDQARRFSESSPSLSPFALPPLPQVPDFSAWTARFWNSSSPPPSVDFEDGSTEPPESTVQALARTIQLWTHQLNADPFPSPPLEPIHEPGPSQDPVQEDTSTVEFPPLEPQPTENASHPPLLDQRTNSETSLNPARRLQTRARFFSDQTRGHSQSDPFTGLTPVRPVETQNEAPRPDIYMEDGQPRRRDGSDTLPEDDGMGPLRQRINAIWTGPGTPMEKSKLIHILMNERHKTTQRTRNTSRLDAVSSPPGAGLTREPIFKLQKKDLAPTYAPPDIEELDDKNEPPTPVLGCIHYRRNVKLQCFSCEKWYTCRLCHDEAEAHVLPRRETRHMLCMLCKSPQPASQFCRTCGEQAACYYCPICKLWNNDPRKAIYHCDDCGLCRLGEGLGKDFFHCKTCAACMSIEAEQTHKCIERSTKCDCPICGEYLFTSSLPVAFMRCGHSIHNSCFKDLCNTTYKCPLCSKSIANMESQFRRLDRSIEEQPMPVEYRDKKSYIFCNDCNSRCVAAYHWLGTKCVFCDSYNTVQLEMLGDDQSVQMQIQVEQEQDRANEAGVGERAITASQTHTPVEELIPTAPATQEHAAPRPAPQRAHTVGPTATSPVVNSPWLMPHSPSARSARSVSPAVGSYFGTDSQRSTTPTTIASGYVGMAAGMAGAAAAAGAELARRISTAGRASPMDEDEDMDFWGGQSPRSNNSIFGRRSHNMDSSSESEDDNDPDAMEEDDDDDEEADDAMDIFGHR
jgi:hypothetical protein